MGVRRSRRIKGERYLLISNEYSYHDQLSSYTRTDTTDSPTPEAAWDYGYLPDGDRLFKQDTFTPAEAEFYLHDSGDVIADYTLDDDTYTLIAAYINGNGIDGKVAKVDAGTDDAHYYVQEALGSVHQLLDGDGDVEQVYLNDAWGNAVYSGGSTENRYQYTGRERDTESDLMYYRARMYDTRTGRFTQKDPSGMLDGMNRYIYCSNNPVNGTPSPWFPLPTDFFPLARITISYPGKSRRRVW